MREISISDFRQQCLSLMDHLPAEGILITRHGLPVARLFPARAASCSDLIGTVAILCDNVDDLFDASIPANSGF